MGQLSQKLRPNWAQWDLAAGLFIHGLLRKVVLADSLAPVVNHYYQHLPQGDFILVLFIHVLFCLQIYNDFCGYSEMAWGLALIMNIDLMENLRRPYLSLNLKEFWSRWHISLSTWFRGYVYIPLGGNKINRIRTLINLFLVFLLSGLRHGASICFIMGGLSWSRVNSDSQKDQFPLFTPSFYSKN